MAATVYSPASSLDIGPKNCGKVSAMDAAVLAMDVPKMIVEMARAFQLHEHGRDFESAQQLYELAEELMMNPQKQSEVGKKISQTEREAMVVEEEKTKMTLKDLCPAKEDVEEDEAMLRKKQEEAAGVREAAEMQEQTLTLASAKPSNNKAQLKEKVQRLARENHRLRQRKMCRKCKEVDLATSGVTFLPCGHFITCEACSEAFEDCPACGKSIMGTVRTFLS